MIVRSQEGLVGLLVTAGRKAGRIDQLASPLGHVFTGGGWAQPSWQRMRSVSPRIELGDQQSALRLEHPMHLLHSGLLIIFGDVVQASVQADGVERGIGKGSAAARKPPESDWDLAACALWRSHVRSSRQLHRHRRHVPSGATRSANAHRQLAGAAPHIENPITGLHSKIIGKCLAEPLSTSAEQAR